jgi:hypothetical protein
LRKKLRVVNTAQEILSKKSGNEAVRMPDKVKRQRQRISKEQGEILLNLFNCNSYSDKIKLECL